MSAEWVATAGAYFRLDAVEDTQAGGVIHKLAQQVPEDSWAVRAAADAGRIFVLADAKDSRVAEPAVDAAGNTLVRKIALDSMVVLVAAVVAAAVVAHNTVRLVVARNKVLVRVAVRAVAGAVAPAVGSDQTSCGPCYLADKHCSQTSMMVPRMLS